MAWPDGTPFPCRRLLLPLDGSCDAEQGLPVALALACHARATLILLRVVAPPPGNRRLPPLAREVAEGATLHLASRYLYQLALSLIRDYPLVIQVELAKGPPHSTIVQVAEQEQVDLIVMGTRNHSWLKRRLLGSVSERVVARSHIPVLLVPG